MHHRRGRSKSPLIQGVLGESVHSEFAQIGDTLPPDRVSRFFNQGEVMWCDAQGIAVNHSTKRFGIDPETCSQLFRRGDTVGKL
jgi:hypothetical protein